MVGPARHCDGCVVLSAKAYPSKKSYAFGQAVIFYLVFCFCMVSSLDFWLVCKEYMFSLCPFTSVSCFPFSFMTLLWVLKFWCSGSHGNAGLLLYGMSAFFGVKESISWHILRYLFCCDETWKLKACGSATAHTSDISLEVGGGSEFHAQRVRSDGFLCIQELPIIPRFILANRVLLMSDKWCEPAAATEGRGLVILNALGAPIVQIIPLPSAHITVQKLMCVLSMDIGTGKQTGLLLSPSRAEAKQTLHLLQTKFSTFLLPSRNFYRKRHGDKPERDPSLSPRSGKGQ